MKHKFIALVLGALMLLALCIPAMAVDAGYSGPLDPETGEPEGESNPQGSSTRIALSTTMFYDWGTHDFAYPIPDTLVELHSNAADTMVMTTPVYISLTGDASLSVYRDGVEYLGDLSRIDAVGGYAVSVNQGGQSQRIMSFVVVGPSTNALHTLLVPDGFYLLEATRDENPIYADRYSVSMEAEGNYTVEYECSGTDIVYKLVTRIDRTPPALSFTGKTDSEGRIRSALKFSGLEEGDSIFLTRFGEWTAPKLNGDGTGEVTEAGNYTMLVTDSAGNTVEYSFIILQYYNMQSWVFFLLVFIVLAAVIIYIVVKRRRLKVA